MEKHTEGQATERDTAAGRLLRDWQRKLVECCGIRHPEAICDEEIARRFVELQEEVKRKDVQIRDLHEKLHDESLKIATFCADYEKKLNELNWRDFDEFRYGFQYYRDEADALHTVYDRLRSYVPVLVKQLEREMAKYERFSSGSELKEFYPPFQIDASKALNVLNTLQSVLDLYENPPADQEKIMKMSQEMGKLMAMESKKGFRRLFPPDTYQTFRLLDGLHKLIDGQTARSYVPYILLLLEEKALVESPSWKDVCDEFVKAKGCRSEYYKYMRYTLSGRDGDDTFPKKEIENKHSVIKEMLKRCSPMPKYPEWFFDNDEDNEVSEGDT